MTKRRNSQNKARRQDRWIAVITYAVAFLILLAIAAGAGYYFGFDAGRSHTKKAYEKERAATAEMLEKLQNAAKKGAETTAPELTKRLQGVLERDQQKYSAAHEYADDPTIDRPVDRPVKLTANLPKLAIIIDDVAFPRDIRLIKELNLPLTMSFLPPSPNHPNSAKLAQKEPYYMVHLPLEAKNFSAEEPSTLRVHDTQYDVTRRVAELKKLFPKVEFVNNHTGSTFTADETAMNRLVFALNKEGIRFIDSRTTAETKVPVVMKNYGMPYLARDVFLDHHPDIASVKKQIARAIEVAKTHGSAIAIGHPHKNTLEALRQSRDLLQEVELVRIDRLL